MTLGDYFDQLRPSNCYRNKTSYFYRRFWPSRPRHPDNPPTARCGSHGILPPEIQHSTFCTLQWMDVQVQPAQHWSCDAQTKSSYPLLTSAPFQQPPTSRSGVRLTAWLRNCRSGQWLGLQAKRVTWARPSGPALSHSLPPLLASAWFPRFC